MFPLPLQTTVAMVPYAVNERMVRGSGYLSEDVRALREIKRRDFLAHGGVTFIDMRSVPRLLLGFSFFLQSLRERGKFFVDRGDIEFYWIEAAPNPTFHIFIFSMIPIG
jgi:hypothetical protein